MSNYLLKNLQIEEKQLQKQLNKLKQSICTHEYYEYFAHHQPMQSYYEYECCWCLKRTHVKPKKYEKEFFF